MGRRAAMAVAAALVLVAAPAVADERFVFGGAMTLAQRTSPEALDRPLLGTAVSLGLLEPADHEWGLGPGFDFQVGTSFRSDGLWIGDLSLVWVATLRLTDKAANPFVSFGPDAAFIGGDDDQDGRLALGVRGDVGLHGILLDWLYWRARFGFVAVGIAALRSELTVGYAFDD